VVDANIASISGSGVLRSKEVGKTQVIVRDTLNTRNYHFLTVEVTPIF
jgi:hypothetical protein